MADLKRMMDAAGQQLFLYPEVTDGERFKRFIKRMLFGQKQAPVDPFSWPNAMLAGGLLAAFAGTGQEQGFLDAAAYLEQWSRKGCRLHYADNVMNGMLALWIEGLLEKQDEKGKIAGIKKTDSAEKGEESADIKRMAIFPRKRGGVRKACHDAREACAAWLRQTQRTADGIYPYRPQHPDWLFADTIGMVCPFLCRYGVQEKDEVLFQTGVAQILRFLEKGMDQKSGLPYHGYDEKSGIKYGVIGWGRACGWLLKGMAESLPWLAKGMEENFSDSRAAFEKILCAYRELVRAVLLYQRPDGGFSWQLPALEGPRDSSAEGMIGTALSLGLRCGFLNRSQKDGGTIEAVLLHLFVALERSVDGGVVRDSSGECRGFAEYPQVYGWYPWGQGSVLEFFGMEEQRIGKYGNS